MAANMLNVFHRMIIHIVDPSAAVQPALRAAMTLAQGQKNSHLTLFHALSHRGLLEHGRKDDALIEEARDLILHDRATKLQELASTLPFKTECTTLWSTEGWLDLTRLAESLDASLVISETSPQSRWKRMTLSNDDWQLIRYCPTDLMLVKSGSERVYRRVLAAVDPLHADDKPSSLDHRILEVAKQVRDHLGSEMIVLNFVPPMLSAAPTVTEPLLAADTSAMTAAVEAHRKRVQALIDQYCGEGTNALVALGDPADEIAAACARDGDEILVMGAVARSALGRFLIGNTAEKVLDAVPCDLLIVKPEVRTPVAEATGSD